MKKKCKVVALVTSNKDYALIKGDFDWSVKTPGIDPNLYGSTKYHLYLVSDDEIRVGDWYCSTDRRTSEYGVIKCETQRLQDLLANAIVGEVEKYKKIITTTDPTLELPLIPQEFVKSYCDEPVDEVFVEVVPKYNIQVNGQGIQKSVFHHHEVILYPVETSWNKEQIEWWLIQEILPEFVRILGKPVGSYHCQDYLDRAMSTLDDLGQRYNEFQEDQKADAYKREFEDRNYYDNH